MFVRVIAGAFAVLALSACGGAGAPVTSNVNTAQVVSPIPPTPSSGPPTISGSPSTSVATGSSYSFVPTTTDPSGGTLTFSIQNKPSWASFNIHTGQISGTPTSSSVGYDGNIVIGVSDGTSTASLQSFGITVTSAAGSPASGASCSSQSGALQLSAQVVRATGISPLLVFFDASATSDSAVKTSVAQNVVFTWNFGDTGPSGGGNWAYGSNPGGNSMNVGSGIVAAHLYRTAGSDTNYTATVTATDGTNTATCSIGVTAYDPGGSNGFAGAATTCISSSGTPVAGSGGCPAGANVLKTSSIQSALSSAYGNGKRLLFKCGDTFSGDDGGNPALTAVQWAIGAYGGCQDTQTNRPIFSNNGSNFIFEFSGSTGNGTLSDFVCQGNQSSGGCTFASGGGVMYQVTLYNLTSNNEQQSYYWSQCSQCGLVQVVMNGMGWSDSPGNPGIGTFINYGEFNPPYSGNTFNNINYQAVIGSHFDGGATNFNNNAETVRISACPYCYISNNDIWNAGPNYAVLKFHGGNTTNSSSTWAGMYTQYDEISDNYFYGTSGANSVEIAPQNAGDDERLRYIVLERNIFAVANNSGREVSISGVNITVRDNAFSLGPTTAYGIQSAQLGVEPHPQNVEIYNNSFYATSGSMNNAAIEISDNGMQGTTPAGNSYIANNLAYFPGQSGLPTVDNYGSGNTVSNNTATVTTNPSFTDASGTMKKITDWKPTANYSGGTSVPVFYDALGAPWPPSWDLGAVHH
jgi:hypothetical protein